MDLGYNWKTFGKTSDVWWSLRCNRPWVDNLKRSWRTTGRPFSHCNSSRTILPWAPNSFLKLKLLWFLNVGPFFFFKKKKGKHKGEIWKSCAPARHLLFNERTTCFPRFQNLQVVTLEVLSTRWPWYERISLKAFVTAHVPGCSSPSNSKSPATSDR